MITNKFLKELPKEERLITQLKEWKKICSSAEYFISNYIWIVDINKQGEIIPFELYSYQSEAAEQFSINRLNLTMKSRQTGLTTFTQAFVVWWMITKNQQICKCIANRKEISKKFLKGVRNMLDTCREVTGEKLIDKKTNREYYKSWLIPDYDVSNNAKESFGLTNGSTIQAEGNTPEAGRGDSLHLCIIDEVASIDYQRSKAMEDIWASAGPALTRSKGTCIAISTPKGKSGWYFDQYINSEEKGWTILNATWKEHPIYNLGMYQWIKDEGSENGYIKFYNEGWQNTEHPDDLKKYKTKDTYEFIKDGKVRSPWYDVESKKLGIERTTCELDCSFSGSGGEVLSADVLDYIKNKCIMPIRIGALERDTETYWKNYYVYKECEYIDKIINDKIIRVPKEYLLVVDIATGDGSDSSAISVVDVFADEVVATFKDDKVSPDLLAYIVKRIGIEFGTAEVVIEYNGPGQTCLLKLQNDLGYPDNKIYRTTLKAKDPNEKDGAKRKLGFWQSSQTRSLGGDVLEETLNANSLILNCKRYYKEFETWVWRDGRRDHLPGKHDDLIMTLTMYSYIKRYVKEYYFVKVSSARKVQASLISRTKTIRNYSNNLIDEEGFRRR